MAPPVTVGPVAEAPVAPVAAAPGAPAAVRHPELDWLRIGAVLLVFVVHTAQIFSPFEAWHIGSADRSLALGMFTVLVGAWLLPLFMLVAGASTYHALRRRSVAVFFRVRVLRLLVPLVAGTLLVMPVQQYYRSLARGAFDGSYLSFYPRFFDGVYPSGHFSYGHLWFLLYLFVVMTLALPVLQYLRSDGGRRVVDWLARLCERGPGVLWLIVPIAASQLALRVSFTPVTGVVFNDWATVAWFLLVFVFGFVLMSDERLLAALDRQWQRAVWPALAATLVLVAWASQGDIYQRIPGEPSLWYLAFWISFTTATWSSLIVLFGGARRHFASPVRGLARTSEAAYPFYILHQPVIVMVAYYLIDRPLALPARFVAILALAFGLTALLLLAVRQVPGVRLLFGLPTPRPHA